MTMDSNTSTSYRPNTSSTTNLSQVEGDTNSNHGWSFLQTDPNTFLRSRPPSTYIRSSNSASSRSPLQNYSSHSQTLSRSLLNQFSTSTGHRSVTSNPSLPSQPVLLRINANNAYTHTSRTPRRSVCTRPIHRDKVTQLPTLEEFSIQGILSAISEDIEGDLEVISEVLGRSRFVLADQHESQMAPLGEIRGIEDVAEEDALRMTDDVTILREDASLVEGSNSGSAAYGLLERLQAVPRTTNIGTVVERPTTVEEIASRNVSSPSVAEPLTLAPVNTMADVREMNARRPDGPARAVVSETHISAEADGVSSGMVPIISEAGRRYPLYAHDDTDIFESTTTVREVPDVGRRRSYLTGITNWFSRSAVEEDQDAEARLRVLLNR